jgi:hypothetical protein
VLFWRFTHKRNLFLKENMINIFAKTWIRIISAAVDLWALSFQPKNFKNNGFWKE